MFYLYKKSLQKVGLQKKPNYNPKKRRMNKMTNNSVITLSSNIATLKERGLESKTHEISVVVLESELEKGNSHPTLYAFRYGMIYDPMNEFKPNIEGGHKLPSKVLEEYYKQLDAARIELAKKIEKYKKGPANMPTNTPTKDNTAELEEMKKALEEATKLIKAQQEELKEAKSNKNEPIRHEKFDSIIKLLERKQAVYLHGPAGTGKSKIAEQAAEYLNLSFYPVSTVTQEFKLTGFIDGNGIFHDTNFYKAVKNGGLFFIDEMDSATSEVLVAINGCLASGYFDFPNETIYAHKDFRVIAAGNTIGRGADMNYTARNALDMSTLNRFWAIQILYSPAIDLEVAHNDIELVEFAQELRKASEKSGIMILMSYRSISRIADFQDIFSLVEIMENAIIKGVATDDVRMLARNMDMTSSNKYYTAFQKAA
jgi:cobaltochelatase CobS